MKIFLNILKEIGIWLLILIILAAVTVVTFKDQLPYDEEIRKGEEYASVNLKEYSVSSSDRISEVTAVMVTHEADKGQIVEAESDVRIQTGKNTPFGSISGTSDLPTEKVGSSAGNDAGETSDTNTSDGTNANTDKNSATSKDEGEKLEYPEADLIEGIEADQSKSAESVANDRFDNEK